MNEIDNAVRDEPAVEASPVRLRISAVGANVIVRTYEPQSRVGDLYLPRGALERPWGEVMSVGPGRIERRIIDGDTRSWEHRPICGGVVKAGSKIIYTQGLKIEVPEAGGTFWIVEEEAIVAVVEDSA